jgi:hypothetical protein
MLYDALQCLRLLAAQVDAATAVYPGRASVSAALDLLITLLHWGANGVLSFFTASVQFRQACTKHLLFRLLRKRCEISKSNHVARL